MYDSFSIFLVSTVNLTFKWKLLRCYYYIFFGKSVVGSLQAIFHVFAVLKIGIGPVSK
jgi:hypothetical protein